VLGPSCIATALAGKRETEASREGLSLPAAAAWNEAPVLEPMVSLGICRERGDLHIFLENTDGSVYSISVAGRRPIGEEVRNER